MDERSYETLRLTAKTIDEVNNLNKHIITCVTIILCTAFLVFGVCSMYTTYKQYDYELDVTSFNENTNRNFNENGVGE